MRMLNPRDRDRSSRATMKATKKMSATALDAVTISRLTAASAPRRSADR